MSWILFVGGDIRDRDRFERAAAEAGFEVRLYTPGSWDPIEDPHMVVIDLDRQPIPERLPEMARLIGYYSHVNEVVAEAARQQGVEVIPRGQFWKTLGHLLES